MKQLAGLSDAFENNTLDFSREISGVTRAVFWRLYTVYTAQVSTETELVNENENLWKLVRPDAGKFKWERTGIANRLATSGEEWAFTMARENIGTATTQMLVLDYKLFIPGKPVPGGMLWIYEHLPYFEDIYTISGQPQKVELYGDYYTYDDCPRAKMFRRDHTKLKDLDSTLKYMG
ncbi:hypothetical protein V5799_029214, partial [Amblyomma americanum]